MDVSDEEVSDKNGCLSRSMTIKAINTIMTERIRVSRVASEIVFQPMNSDTRAPLHEERVITVREKLNLHLELYHRYVTVGMRIPDRVLCQHVTIHVEKVHEAEMFKVLSARTNFCHVSASFSPRRRRAHAHLEQRVCHQERSAGEPVRQRRSSPS